MAAIAPHTPYPTALFLNPKTGNRYLLFMGRSTPEGGREIAIKTFPENMWREAVDEGWTHSQRGYPHMALFDAHDGMRVLESGHITTADGQWVW